MTLACEDSNSKLVVFVTVAIVDDEDRVGKSLLHTWELKLGIIKPIFCSDFEQKVCSRF